MIVGREGDHRRDRDGAQIAASGGREVEQRAVGVLGDDVFLLQQLHHVGDRLQQAEAVRRWSGPMRLCMRAAILRSNHSAMAVVVIEHRR